MTEKTGARPPRLKERLENLCTEMIEKGILFSEAMDQFERCFITEVMRRNNGNLVRSADCLGIHRNTLSKKVNHYRIGKG
ncbi:MAG TPA: helix-turn-helix domain-containing protein [Acidobacteriota bacterium]|nr:helix-turn-helix domain-containing protein [Acidobacteriota bacterium]